MKTRSFTPCDSLNDDRERGNVGYNVSAIMFVALIFILIFGGGQSWLLSVAEAQNIGINITGNTPNASSMLDVDANDKGVFVPRITLTATTNPSPISPVPGVGEKGLLVYNTATINDVVPGFYYWDGAKWILLVNSSTSNSNHGKQLFTSDGAFTTPAGVTTVWVTMSGGGGGGGSGEGSGTSNGAGGGGGAAAIFAVSQAVTPSTSYSITVGTSGAGAINGLTGGTGGTSSFDVLLSCAGGVGGGGCCAGAGGAAGGGGGAKGGGGAIIYGTGGGSIFGAGGAGLDATSGSGENGAGYGGGGGAGYAGGAGAPGFVLVEW